MITIFGDSLEKLKTIPSQSVHTVITDIPYGISFSSWDVIHTNSNSSLLGSSPAQQSSSVFKTRGKPKNGWSKNDKNIPLEFQNFCFDFLKEINRILLPAGTVVSFTGRQYQHRYTIAGEDAGLIHKDTIAWDKTTASFKAQAIGQVIGKRNGDFSDKRRLGNLAPVFEPIVVMFKPYKIGGTITDCYINYGTGTIDCSEVTKNIISYSSKVQDKLHETQKPLGLMEILVKIFSKEGQTVLDPFMGSGTTGVACVLNKREFIGIEKDEKYFKIADERIRGVVGA